MAERIEDAGEDIGYAPPVGWGQWADGAKWKLHRGPLDKGGDFEQDAERARKAFLSWASRQGFRTRSHVIDENTLEIRVVKGKQPRQSARKKTRAGSQPAGDAELAPTG